MFVQVPRSSNGRQKLQSLSDVQPRKQYDWPLACVTQNEFAGQSAFTVQPAGRVQ